MIYSTDLVANDGSLDDVGHGTNVAAIAARTAPGAKIIMLDIFTKTGSTVTARDSDVIGAINWVVDNVTGRSTTYAAST